MERRLGKIENILHEIVDEQENLTTNLQCIIQNLKFNLSEIYENTHNFELKHTRNVLQVSMKLLQVLCDLNLTLETFSEENKLELVAVKTPSVEVEQEQHALTNMVLPSAQHVEDGPGDIDVLKDSFKKFREKLGVTESSISTLKDFYDKPLVAPSTSQVDLPTYICPETSDSVQTDDFLSISSFPTSDSATPEKPQNTAIEKLNNTKFLNRHEEAIQKQQETEPVVSVLNNLKLVAESTSTSSSKRNHKQNNRRTNGFKQPKITRLYQKDIPKVGDQCAFSYVVTPNEFYIHLLDEECAQVDKISENIKQKVQSYVWRHKQECHEVLGQFAVAYVDKYQAWYRVEITKWNLQDNSDEVTIFLVDFGYTLQVSYTKLREMPRTVKDIPMLALKCHFPLLFPPGSTAQNLLPHWPETTIDALIDISGLFTQNDAHTFRLVYVAVEGDSLSIDLHNASMDEDSTVGQLLLDLELATQIIFHGEDDMFLEDAEDFVEPLNINEAIIGYDARDEARSCKYMTSEGTCFKGKHCKLEHLPLSKDGFTTDKTLVFHEALNSLQMPSNGSKIYILITNYIDATRFYVQIINSVPHSIGVYDVDQELFCLMDQMNAQKMINEYEPFKEWPSLGQILVVKHWSKKWLRGIVRQVTSNEYGDMKAQVFTLDYGDTIDAPLSALRQIKGELLHLPFQIVECYLSSYKELPNIDRKQFKTFFCQRIGYFNFFANVISKEKPMKLQITYKNGYDVGEMLEKEGFVIKCEDDLNVADNCVLDLY